MTGGQLGLAEPSGGRVAAQEPGRSLSPCALACPPQLPAAHDCPFQRWRRTAPSPFSPFSFNKELRETPSRALHTLAPTPPPTPTNWKISALAWLLGGSTGVWLLCGRPGNPPCLWVFIADPGVLGVLGFVLHLLLLLCKY